MKLTILKWSIDIISKIFTQKNIQKYCHLENFLFGVLQTKKIMIFKRSIDAKIDTYTTQISTITAV